MTDEELVFATFCVMFSELSVYRLESGQYAVTEPTETLFDTAEEAAAFFVKRRHECKIGFDFEK